MPSKNKRRQQKKAKQATAAPAGPAPAEGTAEWWKAEGNSKFAAHQYEDAIAAYNKAIELDPTNKVFFSNRSASHAALGTPESIELALKDAERAIEIDPEWPKGYFRKGQALKALNRNSDALVSLKEGQRLQPENAEFVTLIEEIQKLKLQDRMEEKEDENADQDKFQALESWLLKGGAKFPLIYMKQYSENNRGVHARVTVPPEQEIMEIPVRFLITVEMGKECPIGKKMLAARVDVSATKHCYLAVFVLWDRRNESSFYQPYYRILPTEYPNMPIFWPEEVLAERMKGSYIVTQVADRKKHIEEDYEEICRAAPEFREMASLHEFTWARMMVASRNFGVKIGEIKTDALVPYADMLNHYRPRETRWTFDNSKSAFTITSLVSLRGGQQVYDSYGKKCNSRFLVNYGFAVENNRDPDGQCHNEVRLEFSLLPPSEDKWRSSKLGLLNGSSPVRGIRVSTWPEHESTLEAFSFLRFIHAEGNDILYLPQIGDDVDLGKKPIAPISYDNEIRVLRHMARLCKEQLARYPTTLEEDLKVLEEGRYEFGSNERNCIVVLKGEKEVCHNYIQLEEIAIPLLEMQWKDCKKIINKKYKARSDINNYINLVVAPLVKKKAGAH